MRNSASLEADSGKNRSERKALRSPTAIRLWNAVGSWLDSRRGSLSATEQLRLRARAGIHYVDGLNVYLKAPAFHPHNPHYPSRQRGLRPNGPPRQRATPSCTRRCPRGAVKNPISHETLRRCGWEGLPCCRAGLPTSTGKPLHDPRGRFPARREQQNLSLLRARTVQALRT